MNIVFMGTPDFAVPALRTLLRSKHTISAVVTAPDKPKGRGLKLSESAVKQFAASEGLRVLQPDKLKDESFVNKTKEIAPDLIIVVAFRILPKEIYSIPKFGSFNLHASLLPKYRGAAPINRAIMNGENETGVTTFFLRDKVDTGNIILQKKCTITDEDDAGTLHDKLSLLGAEAIMETVDMIEEKGGQIETSGQDDSAASLAPKIFKDDCRINWERPAKQNYNFIRGLAPYPAAFTGFNGKVLKIFKTKISAPANDFKSRKLKIGEGKILAGCGDGNLEILELQLEGKKRMSAHDFLIGFREEGSFKLE